MRDTGLAAREVVKDADGESAKAGDVLGTGFSDGKCNTVGRLILRHLGRVQQFSETIVIEGVSFQVLRAECSRICTLIVCRPPEAGNPE